MHLDQRAALSSLKHTATTTVASTPQASKPAIPQLPVHTAEEMSPTSSIIYIRLPGLPEPKIRMPKTEKQLQRETSSMQYVDPWAVTLPRNRNYRCGATTSRNRNSTVPSETISKIQGMRHTRAPEAATFPRLNTAAMSLAAHHIPSAALPPKQSLR